MASQVQQKNVVVLGAGVVGLTTAVKIQETGKYNVSILAEVLPMDQKTIKYTSHWAGAHHVISVTEDARQQKMDLATFKLMWELSTPGMETAQYFRRHRQTDYYSDLALLGPLDRMPDYEIHDQATLPPNIAIGVSFTTVTIDPPNYLIYLARRFTEAGGVTIRASVQHINQVLEGGTGVFTGASNPTPPDAVVVCTGLGTRFLGGVEDKNVYPIRGQTVLIRAPWIDFGRTIGDHDNWTYTVPRPTGDVILGGSKGYDDWYPRPRAETTRDVLERTFKMCPELAPPEIRARREPTIEDILPLVIEEGCGLRPGRIGGVRLDIEWRIAGKTNISVPIVFNYGHGGYGFQSSWGSADAAYTLLEEVLKDKI